MDATGQTAAEIHQMDRWNRHVTALLRARYYREKQPDESAQQKM